MLQGSGTGSGAKGGIFINSNWSLDASGLYQIAPDRPWGFNVAANVNGREGYPVPYVSRTNLNDGLGTRSVLAGGNDTFCNDDVIIPNTRVEKEFTFGDWGLTLSVDAFNLLNESYALQREVRLPGCNQLPQAVLPIAGVPTSAHPQRFGALGGPCLTAGTGLNRGDFVNEVVSPRIFRIGARLNFR